MTIDLRSDTVTLPDSNMRRAMAEANLGDDVYGEDPTVMKLESSAADLLGKEAAVFVPSGVMANQIALRVHCQRGEKVAVPSGAHIAFNENGAASDLAGVQFSLMGKTHTGHYCAADLEAALLADDIPGTTQTTLVCVENTHNQAGGIPWDKDQSSEIVKFARSKKRALHLDGARLVNASLVTGQSCADLAWGFDTVSFCFSKGLGAPVGSVLSGTKALITKARWFRKMYGGGMRQAGILAAGALYALENNQKRIESDHANARALAEALEPIEDIHVRSNLQRTNMVLIDLATGLPSAAAFVKVLADHGLLAGVVAPRRLRLVTHLGIDHSACAEAASLVNKCVQQCKGS